MKRKYFVCEDFGHITCHCRKMKNRQEKGPTQRFLNKFEVLKSRVMNIEEESRKETEKDRKMILREKKLKKNKTVEV